MNGLIHNIYDTVTFRSRKVSLSPAVIVLDFL